MKTHESERHPSDEVDGISPLLYFLCIFAGALLALLNH